MKKSILFAFAAFVCTTLSSAQHQYGYTPKDVQYSTTKGGNIGGQIGGDGKVINGNVNGGYNNSRTETYTDRVWKHTPNHVNTPQDPTYTRYQNGKTEVYYYDNGKQCVPHQNYTPQVHQNYTPARRQ